MMKKLLLSNLCQMNRLLTQKPFPKFLGKGCCFYLFITDIETFCFEYVLKITMMGNLPMVRKYYHYVRI
jgi:hypothetical protein